MKGSAYKMTRLSKVYLSQITDSQRRGEVARELIRAEREAERARSRRSREKETTETTEE